MSALALTPALVGCENLPGNKQTQGAVIGGAAGAAAGAIIGKHNRLVGGLIGGALGAGGGYLIGAAMHKNDEKHRDEAIKASDRDRDNPPTASEARSARTADLNGDGYVTLNEVVAMRDANLSDDEMIRRLEDTGQVFSLSDEQETYLRDRNVSDRVIRAMRSMNQERDTAGDTARTAGERNADDRYDRADDHR
ncbi:MAG TPA: glycine zipper domain-containing protein [Tepidisphaeraceae bacterium]